MARPNYRWSRPGIHPQDWLFCQPIHTQIETPIWRCVASVPTCAENLIASFTERQIPQSCDPAPRMLMLSHSLNKSLNEFENLETCLISLAALC